MGEPVAGRPVGQPGGGQVAGVDLRHRGRLDGGQRRGQPGHQAHGVDELVIGPCRPQGLGRVADRLQRRRPGPVRGWSRGRCSEIDMGIANQAPPTPKPVINRVIPPSEIIHRKRNSGPLIVHRNRNRNRSEHPQASGGREGDLRRHRTPPPTETTPRRSSPPPPAERRTERKRRDQRTGVSTSSTHGRVSTSSTNEQGSRQARPTSGSRQARPTSRVSTSSTNGPGSRQARPTDRAARPGAEVSGRGRGRGVR